MANQQKSVLLPGLNTLARLTWITLSNVFEIVGGHDVTK